VKGLFYCAAFLTVCYPFGNAQQNDPFDLDRARSIHYASTQLERQLYHMRSIRASALSDSADLAWSWATYANALVIMARRNDRMDPSLLEDFESVFDLLKTSGSWDELRGANRVGWSSFRYFGGRQIVSSTHAALIVAPILTWCRDVLGSKARLSAVGKARVDQLIGLSKAVLLEFDSDLRTGSNGSSFYVSGFESEEKVLPYNCQSSIGKAFLLLWLCTGEQRWLDHTTSIATFVRSGMREVGGRISWPYAPYWSDGFDDVAHAGSTVDYVVLAFREGIAFSDQDIVGILSTYFHIAQGNSYADRIDGSSLGDGPRKINTADQWMCLSQFDPDVLKLHLGYDESFENRASTVSRIYGLAVILDHLNRFDSADR